MSEPNLNILFVLVFLKHCCICCSLDAEACDRLGVLPAPLGTYHWEWGVFVLCLEQQMMGPRALESLSGRSHALNLKRTPQA